MFGNGSRWTITDDPSWSRYMMSNPVLRASLEPVVLHEAQVAVAAHPAGSAAASSHSFSVTTQVTIQNGEGIIGWQYLHGTNRNVGGFQFRGTTNVTPNGGSFNVTVMARYTWNDRMDPNFTYGTDIIKSSIGRIFRIIGGANDYDFVCSWHVDTVLTIGPRNAVSWATSAGEQNPANFPAPHAARR
jgi:hypothetical protein